MNVFYGEQAGAVRRRSGHRRVARSRPLIGPSGCGKSTFLRCINRMNDTIDGCRVTGKITLDGAGHLRSRSIDVVELRARVGMVFQKPNPFPKSIYENVAYGPRIHGLAALEGRARRDRRRRACSGPASGKRSRTACTSPAPACPAASSSACASPAPSPSSPEVILMDEPCSALDPIATAQDRGTDRRTARELHDRHRHPLDAAGGARLAAHRLLPSRRAGRGRRRPNRSSPIRSDKRTQDYITGRFG